jgi:hypothetical protein
MLYNRTVSGVRDEVCIERVYADGSRYLFIVTGMVAGFNS